jgi:hypothetical protein
MRLVCKYMVAEVALYFEKKATPFDSTKHQYSSDLWPLKIKRNCIVDKSLAVRIVDKIEEILAPFVAKFAQTMIKPYYLEREIFVKRCD